MKIAWSPFWRMALALAAVATMPISAAQSQEIQSQISAYRADHEREILEEFSRFLELPNVAADPAGLERNAAYLLDALQRRGLEARYLRPEAGGPPLVFAQLSNPVAEHTLLIYAHYDGQPVDPAEWRSDPWVPVIRAGPGPDAAELDWRSAEAIDPEWRLFARSSSDDKAPIQALLSALDALRAAGRTPRVNLKLLLDGEEEHGSPHIGDILDDHRELLTAELMILADGPRHPSGRMQIYFGARGFTALELTAYGPVRALHDGHYGNWAPNPAIALSRLIASMRDEEGRILIPGFYEDVRPLTTAEEDAFAGLPDVELDLLRSLAIGRTEGEQRLARAVAGPALNLRGLSAGAVGDAAANAIPAEASASIDFRLVPDQTPDRVRARVEAFLRSRGWYLVEEEPSGAVLSAHPYVLHTQWEPGYEGHRSALDGPAQRALAGAIEAALGEPILRIPTAGGSIPMHVFADRLDIPVVGMPTVNADNNQHGPDENIRIGNLWEAIDMFAGILATLDW